MHGHFRHTPIQCVIVAFSVRFFIEPDLFDNNVPFDKSTPIYLISLPWKLRLGLGLDLTLHYLSIFHGEYKENKHLIFREFHGR